MVNRGASQNMVLNKKGIFFTSITIVIISLLLLSYTFYDVLQDRKTIKTRIETMNNFLFAINEDLERQLFASGFRVILLLEQEITETGTYVSDLNATFNEVFFLGTVYGESNDDIELLMTGAKFQDILDSMQSKADKLNIEINMTNPLIKVYQEDPWNIKFSLTTDFTMRDKGNLALWNETKTISALIPITNFQDPFYTIGTNGVILKKIQKSPYTNLTNPNDLLDHAIKSYYINSIDAPSFVNKLQGNYTADPYGVESLVNIQNFSSQGITVKDKSIVDHVYFSASSPANCQISGMPSWFKLDNVHQKFYSAECL